MSDNCVAERLKQYLEFKGLTPKDFERITSLGNGTSSKLSPNTRSTTLRRIERSGVDLNVNWLMTGEGEMLIQGSNLLSGQAQSRTDDRLIPFYDVETTGGFNGLMSGSDEGELVGYVQPGGWFDGRETAAIRHVGDSMIEYPSGCILAVRAVTDTRLLVPGHNYVFETSEYRVTKRYQRGSSPDTIALYSTNTEKYDDGRLVHEPFEIHVSDVRRVFSVLGYIVNQTGEFRLIKP